MHAFEQVVKKSFWNFAKMPTDLSAGRQEVPLRN